MLLVALAGVIAYAGDVLGTTIGRRRLSLFGWRPKRTGQVVGIAVGILIMLVTLSILSIAFRGAASVLLDAQQTAEELASLRRERRELLQEIDAANARIAEADSIIASARLERDEALAARDEANTERVALREEALQFSQSVLELQEEITQVDSELSSVQTQLASAQTSLASIQQERDNAEAELASAQDNIAQAELEVNRLSSQVEQATRARDQALQDAAELRRTQLLLEEERDALNEQIDALRFTVRDLQDQAASLETINAELLESNRSLRIANNALASENDTLRSNVGDLDSRVLSLEDQLNNLRTNLAEQAEALLRAREQVRAVSDGALTFEQDEEVYRVVINARNETDIQSALADAVTTANNLALSRGAGELRLATDTFNDLVAQLASTAQGDLVRFVSPLDQYGTSALEVTFDVRENSQLLDAGQLLLSRPIFLGEGDNSKSDAALRDDVTRLSTAARQALQQRGYSGSALVSTSDVETLLAWLSRLSGEAIVGVVAKDPVYVAEDAALEFVIVR